MYPSHGRQKPGISKLNPTDMNLNAPNDIEGVLVQPQTSSFPDSRYSDRRNSKALIVDHGAAKIIPPPPPLSKRNIWKQQDSDPFLAAIKQCTKSSGSSTGTGTNNATKISAAGESSKRILGLWKARKSKLVLWCKYACDVREDNLVTRKPFTNLPALPRRRLR